MVRACSTVQGSATLVGGMAWVCAQLAHPAAVNMHLWLFRKLGVLAANAFSNRVKRCSWTQGVAKQYNNKVWNAQCSLIFSISCWTRVSSPQCRTVLRAVGWVVTFQILQIQIVQIRHIRLRLHVTWRLKTPSHSHWDNVSMKMICSPPCERRIMFAASNGSEICSAFHCWKLFSNFIAMLLQTNDFANVFVFSISVCWDCF